MTSERAALLIADIGGYTEYMSTHRMSLAHAEVNTARMLDRMIEAARGFDLVEIEGDAAFLSRRPTRRDPDPTVDRDPRRSRSRCIRPSISSASTSRRTSARAAGCKEAGNLKLKFVAHVGEVATQSIRGHTKLVGIDVILVHRLLKNSVSIPEYVLVSEELYHVDEASLPTPVHEITPELEGIGEVRAYFVDVADLDGLLPPPRKPSWGARLGNTFAAVGQGMPYMLGMKQPRKVR